MPDSVSIPADMVFPDGTVSVLKNSDTGNVHLVQSWEGQIHILTMTEETAVALGRTLVDGGSRIPTISEN